MAMAIGSPSAGLYGTIDRHHPQQAMVMGSCSKMQMQLCRVKFGYASSACGWSSSRNGLHGHLETANSLQLPAQWKGKEKLRRTSLIVHARFPNSAAPGVVKNNKFKINLDEYMVTLDKPIGIRFAQTLSGKVFVEALAKQVGFPSGYGFTRMF